MRKLIFSLLLCLPAVNTAWGINANMTYADAWGFHSGMGHTGNVGAFVKAGGLGKGGTHGTYGDEWGLVGMVAQQIVAHGGYFCPYQIQCANKYKSKRTWTEYYRPVGFSWDKCAWLCESGYSGVNCIEQPRVPKVCDKTPQHEKFSGLSMKTYGERNEMVEGEVTGFAQWGSDPEHDIILGIVKFMEHGVIAAPIEVICGRDNWKHIDSFVSQIGIIGNQKTLCAEGYKTNATGSDCEPIDADFCAIQDMPMCPNFPRESYNSKIHKLVADGECVKYFCSDSNKAFPAAGSTECKDCAKGVKGGSNPNNGVCVVCETGQYFDSKTGTCETAAAYTNSELQYGKTHTKNSNPDVNNQCWTQVAPEDYSACVVNGGVLSEEEKEAMRNATVGTLAR